MAKAFFISEEILKQDSIFDSNIDAKYLRSIIEECQDIYILPAIGSKLYNSLQDQIEADTVTDDNAKLLNEYIQPALKNFIKGEAVFTLNFHYTNRAVAIKNTEGAQPSSMSDVKDLMEHYKNRAEFYTKRLIDFLKAYPIEYPDYHSVNSTLDSIQPNNTAYNVGIYLGDDGDCGQFVNGKYYKSYRQR